MAYTSAFQDWLTLDVGAEGVTQSWLDFWGVRDVGLFVDVSYATGVYFDIEVSPTADEALFVVVSRTKGLETDRQFLSTGTRRAA